MKPFFLLLLLFLAGSPLWSQLNTPVSYNALSAKVMAIDLEIINQDRLTTTTTFGLEMAYRRQFTRHLGLAIPLKLGTIDVGELSNRSIFGLEITPMLFPFGTERRLSPYFLAGYGFVAENFETSNQQIPLGGGLNLKIGDNSWFSLKGEYRLSNQELRDNIIVGLGYTYRLSSIDSDGDGIVNHQDRCPEAAGGVATSGCPDTDGDGTPDAEDQCPAMAGVAALHGCPDTDGDGLADAEDSCPEAAGTAATAGCPDADGDGVPDDADDCPDVAGLVATAGCPDADGDGVIDQADDCPGKAGLARLRGCPDRDADGVPDDLDQCPDEGGFLPSGCPDKDKDGIPDREDPCPTQAAKGGCPDTDGDGIADYEDRCPTQAATTEDGCPAVTSAARKTLDYAARAVAFASGSARLKEESFVVLGQIAGILRDYPDYLLYIEGHTDNIGYDENNLVLSRQRASACGDYLVAIGIPRESIRSTGYGASRPKASNATAAGRRENRRVEFSLRPR